MTMSTTTTFRALGTTVHVATRQPRELATAHQLAERVLRDVDEVASRFRADSDLSRVNAGSGHWVEVDPLLVAAVDAARAAAEATDGLVNPLLGRPLVELGYDRDFGLLVELPDDGGPIPQGPLPGPGAWREIRTDPAGGVRIPRDSALDLGAVGKGWAADLVATAYETHLDGSALVSVGGDLRIAGPDAEPWPVAVSEAPGGPAVLVDLDRGGLATSSTQVRRWTRRGVQRHHVLDPRTGLPAAEVWRTVTATGRTCTAANTASTAAIVLGAAAPRWLREHGVAARLVGHDGRVLTLGGWPPDPFATRTDGSAA